MYPYTVNGRNVIFAYIGIWNETITAAYTKSEDGTTVEVAYALCSWKDTFNKARGRQIAMGRLAKGQSLKFADNKDMTLVDQVIEKFPEYSKSVHQMPARVVNEWTDEE